MSDKVNILEEINKMKNLIRTKAGTVISEQPTDINADIETIKKEVSKGALVNSDEQLIVNTLKKYKTKEEFQNFLSQYKATTGKDLSNVITGPLEVSNDKTEIEDLKSHLSTFGVTLDFKSDPKTGSPIATFGGLSATPPAAGAVTERQKGITDRYCSVKDGFYIINNKKHDWNVYVSSLKVTEAEIAEAKKTCPNQDLKKIVTGPTPVQRLVTTAKSLGIENPQMDVVTLQTILNTLNQGPQGVTESKNSVNEELKMMKYLLGYQRGKVISEQSVPAAPASAAAAPPAASTPKDLITLIQTVLNDKFKQPLGPTGADGRWGKFSQDALENALKTIKSGSASKQATPGTEVGAEATTPTSNAAQGAVPTQLRYASSSLTTPASTTSSATPAAATTTDIYTTLVNNKTLVSKNNGNKIVYRGADLPIEQRQELESKLLGMGYRLSSDDRDKSYGDKMIFKKN
jgi:hypothetical protein